MAERSKAPRQQSCTICLPSTEAEYRKIMQGWPKVRSWLQRCYKRMPELFPADFGLGFAQRDSRTSKKTSLRLWRISLNRGGNYSIRPSFVMPHMTARTEDVEKGLFLRKFGVPYHGIASTCGRDPMFWYRLETSLGRNSIVGTTVRHGELPKHLVADEHHQKSRRTKLYIATTVGAGCCLGAALASDASFDALSEAYEIFRSEAWDLDENYRPNSINTDGWKSTVAAWRYLFPDAALLRCFLHGWLKIRDRGKHLDEFRDIGDRIWNAYEANSAALFRRRLRRLKKWSEEHLKAGIVQTEVLDLCSKEQLWVLAYEHPQGHRTSNMLDRIMRGMCRYFEQGQHLHGSIGANDRRARAWALLQNFTPWSPQTTRRYHGCQSPAERLNGHCYHASWLQNLLISASLGGYRKIPPQNPL